MLLDDCTLVPSANFFIFIQFERILQMQKLQCCCKCTLPYRAVNWYPYFNLSDLDFRKEMHSNIYVWFQALDSFSSDRDDWDDLFQFQASVISCGRCLLHYWQGEVKHLLEGLARRGDDGRRGGSSTVHHEWGFDCHNEPGGVFERHHNHHRNGWCKPNK